MLILSRKQNQDIVFPDLGVRIEVSKIRGNTVCLGIEAPKEIAILRGELQKFQCVASAEPDQLKPTNHELRHRLSALALCLHVMQEKQVANQPIDPKIVSAALHELQSIEQICNSDHSPKPLADPVAQFADQVEQSDPASMVMLIDEAALLAGI